MICKKTELVNFRNIERAELEFSDGVNVLVGGNAEGKTNMLEAIYLFALGKSFRGAKEEEIIRFGEENASATIYFKDNARSDVQKISVSMKKGKRRRIEVNGVKINRLSEMIGTFRAVLFCPEHLSIIKDGPSMRRGYLDVAISQFRPVYLNSLRRYMNILEERNRLIRNAEDDIKTFKATIDLWSEQLAHEAANVSYFREIYVKKVEKKVSEAFREMSGDREKTEIEYLGSSKQESYSDKAETEKKYLSLLTENVDRELKAGTTLYGVHKDDMDIKINGKSSRLFASQGQQRSLAIAMKLAEGDICLEETGDNPVLLLDDVLSELDEKRRDYLLGRVRDRQVIITTCERTDFRGAKITEVEKGRYTEV